MTGFVDRLDEVAPLWNERLPASVIGERLGLTKGTVCRLVFNARAKGDPRFPPRPPIIVRRQRKIPKGFTPDLAQLVTAPLPRSRTEQGLVELVDLRPNECRYPTRSGLLKGEHLFCGGPKYPESESYCKKHHFECVSHTGAKLAQFVKANF